jgi:signal transduction histidine kinase
MDSNLRFLVARASWGTELLSRKRERICWGTEGSNPSPSSGESANSRSLETGPPGNPSTCRQGQVYRALSQAGQRVLGKAPKRLVPQDITRVCLNLFSNGFYAATERQKEGRDAKFKPTLKVSTRNLGEAVEIRVRDNGVGIPTEIRDKLFQPFFTTKPTGEGTGLGLSISYDIVTQQHGGSITVDSRVGEFTEFTARLPRAHRSTMAEAAS